MSTDNEIIKALELCSADECWCDDCPYENLCTDTDITKFALDLINRQKAEIERLKTENKDISEQFRILDVECERLEKANEKQKAEIERLKSPCEMQIEVSEKIENSIKVGAVKEFAERLKEKAWHGIWETINHVDVDEIDNLVKEMVGEG